MQLNYNSIISAACLHHIFTILLTTAPTTVHACGRPAQELWSFGNTSRLELIIFRVMQTMYLIAGEGLVGALRHDERIERELGTEQWSGAENSDALHAERIS